MNASRLLLIFLGYILVHAQERKDTEFAVSVDQFCTEEELSTLPEQATAATDVLEGVLNQLISYADYDIFFKLVDGLDFSQAAPYGISMIPTAVPLVFGFLLFLFIFPAFCFILVPCRRCCCKCKSCKPGNRFFLCPCKKKATGSAGLSKIRFLILLIVIAAFAVGTFVTSAMGIHYSWNMTKGVRKLQCAVFVMADKVMGGSYKDSKGSIFIGVDPALEKFDEMIGNTDANGSVVQGVDQIIADTKGFDDSASELISLVGNLTSTFSQTAASLTSLTDLGGSYDQLSYHRCPICEQEVQAIQDIGTNLATGGVAAIRQLRRLVEENFGSGSDIMLSLRSSILASKEPLDAAATAISTVFVTPIQTYSPMITSVDAARNVFTIIFYLVIVGLSVLAILEFVWDFFLRGVPLKKKSQGGSTFPRPWRSCLIFYLFLTITIFSLIIGGILLPICTVLAHFCKYLKESWTTGEQMKQSQLIKGQTGVVLDILTTCMASDGSGDLLGVLGFKDQLGFKQKIDAKFDEIANYSDGAFVDIPKYNELKASVDAIGFLINIRKDSLPASIRDNVDDFIFQSGIQVKDVTVDLAYRPKLETAGMSDTSVSSGLVVGLETLHDATTGILRPYRFLFLDTGAANPIDKDRPFTLGDLTHAQSNTDIEAAIAANRPDLDTPAKITVFKNSLWLAQKKAMLHETALKAFRCATIDTSNSNVDKCHYQSETAPATAWYGKNDGTAGYLGLYIAAQTAKAVETNTALLDQGTTKGAKTRLTDDLQTVVTAPLNTIEEVLNGSNCKLFYEARRGMEDAICIDFIPATTMLSFCMVICGFFALVLFAVYYSLYRFFKESRKLEVPEITYSATPTSSVPPQFIYGAPLMH
eukprot:GHVR01165897.1.p1 GENE.GHVR01165897.1~~GHVR01165897.1.p1  ORF type:complete len:873 (+),score=51.89 GHVR01165897.1:43-2661(+)